MFVLLTFTESTVPGTAVSIVGKLQLVLRLPAELR